MEIRRHKLPHAFDRLYLVIPNIKNQKIHVYWHRYFLQHQWVVVEVSVYDFYADRLSIGKNGTDFFVLVFTVTWRIWGEGTDAPDGGLDVEGGEVLVDEFLAGLGVDDAGGDSLDHWVSWYNNLK